jgi:hypothetical protein
MRKVIVRTRSNFVRCVHCGTVWVQSMPHPESYVWEKGIPFTVKCKYVGRRCWGILTKEDLEDVFAMALYDETVEYWEDDGGPNEEKPQETHK